MRSVQSLLQPRLIHWFAPFATFYFLRVSTPELLAPLSDNLARQHSRFNPETVVTTDIVVTIVHS